MGLRKAYNKVKKYLSGGPPKIIERLLPTSQDLESFLYDPPQEPEQINAFFCNTQLLLSFLGNMQRDNTIVISCINDLERKFSKRVQDSKSEETAPLSPCVLYRRFDVGARPFYFSTRTELDAKIQEAEKEEAKLKAQKKGHTYEPLMLGAEIRYRHAPREKLDIKRLYIKIINPTFRSS